MYQPTVSLRMNCTTSVSTAIVRQWSTKPTRFLRNCCYDTVVLKVAAIGRAAADGLLDGGVLPVVKHIPRHGRATADSHFDLPKGDAPHDSLDIQDFSFFKALNDLPMGMTADLV
jgi:beta-N-acetylhexosaminidase